MKAGGGGGTEAKLTEGVQFDDDVKKMKVDELKIKKTLKTIGLPANGLKLELQTRLQNFRHSDKSSTTSGSASASQLGTGTAVDKDNR
jgi:hypothetical protein